jgi:hypothetical protein
MSQNFTALTPVRSARLADSVLSREISQCTSDVGMPIMKIALSVEIHLFVFLACRDRQSSLTTI